MIGEALLIVGAILVGMANTTYVPVRISRLADQIAVLSMLGFTAWLAGTIVLVVQAF